MCMILRPTCLFALFFLHLKTFVQVSYIFFYLKYILTLRRDLERDPAVFDLLYCIFSFI